MSGQLNVGMNTVPQSGGARQLLGPFGPYVPPLRGRRALGPQQGPRVVRLVRGSCEFLVGSAPFSPFVCAWFSRVPRHL